MLAFRDSRGGRRAFLRAGTLGLGGLTLADALRLRAAESARRDAAAILIFLSGGPSQTDTFDPKPDAPEEFRGPFRSIPTALIGVRVGELFPRIARLLDRMTVVRSLHHGDGSHHHSYHWVLTGAYPRNLHFYVNQRPAVGAVVARFRGPNRPGLPPYVTIPRAASYGGPAYLGPGYGPFPAGDPNSPAFVVPNLKMPSGVDPARLANRKALLGAFDRMRHDLDTHGTAEGMDTFTRSAFELVLGPAARVAFDLGREDDRLRDRYGRTRVGQSCLLARRLVEAGVTFVMVEDYEHTEWDLHGTNGGPGVKAGTEIKGPHLDRAVSALVEDLEARGLLGRTLVVAVGEFGRTPRVNPNGGRDHWGRVFSALLAGGGLRHGQVIGASTAKAETPKERPLNPGDLLATVYHALGIDPQATANDPTGRPIPLVSDGEPICELV